MLAWQESPIFGCNIYLITVLLLHVGWVILINSFFLILLSYDHSEDLFCFLYGNEAKIEFLVLNNLIDS